MINFIEILKATTVLFAVVDILGSIPVIIKIKEKTFINSISITLTCCIIMILFLFVGENILHLFGVNIESFAIAGAVILYIIGFEMILGIEIMKTPKINKKKAGIIPLVFPMIAGAGSMTTLITLRAEYEFINIIIAIIINMIIVYIVFKLTDKIKNIIGNEGIILLEKVFGIIVLSIATKLFISNIINFI